MRLLQHALLFALLMITPPLFANTSHFNPDHEFTITLSDSVSSLDPYLIRSLASRNLSFHIYDTLFSEFNDSNHDHPQLAEASRLVEERVWEIKLKTDIVFHNDQPFTSKDVIYSFNRIKQMPKSEMKAYINRLESYDAVDDYTLKIVTKEPNPFLLHELSRIIIFPSQSKPITTAELDKGIGLIGTGPYRFKARLTNGDILLTRNPTYHHTKPFLKKVRLHYSADEKERLTTFSQQTTHLIDRLKPEEIRLLKVSDKAKLIKAPSHTLFYLHYDMKREQTPFVLDKDNTPLDKNPFLHKKVREALSNSIDRVRLTNTELKGVATPAAQFINKNTIGHDPSIKLPDQSIEDALELLQQTPFNNGFSVTLHTHEEIATSEQLTLNHIKKGLEKIGIHVTMKTPNKRIFYKEVAEHQYSFMLSAISTDGSLKRLLNVLIHTKTEDRGSLNDGRYSNPRVDSMIEKGAKDFNRARAMTQFRLAAELALKDFAIIPLYFATNTWALQSHQGLRYTPDNVEFTLAQNIHP